MAELIICPGCGAPVPAGAPLVFACAYCGKTVDLRGHAGAVAPPPAAQPLGELPSRDELAHFRTLFPQARAAGSLGAALERALHGATNGRFQARPAANAVCAFVRTFQKESGLDIGNDATALERMISAYFKAKVELRSTRSTDVNLPFLSAGPNGPAHFATTLTPDQLARLEAG